MLADLVQRSLFPATPGEDLVARFMAHVRETGEPETFPEISTTKPPANGVVTPLKLDISIPGNRRARWKLAPCPICSFRAPKWASGGTLIWCQATEAIYCIGPKCYGTLWADGRLDVAINRLRRTERELANLQALRDAVAGADAQLTWIARHRQAAARSTELHSELARTAPNIRGAVARAVKGSLTVGSQIAGQGFLRGTWKLSEKLREAERVWLDQKVRAVGGELQPDLENLTPAVVHERLGAIGKARLAMQHVHDRLAEAAAFLTLANVRALAAVGAAKDAPIRFRAAHTASRVQFRSDAGDAWDGPLGLPRPEPLP